MTTVVSLPASEQKKENPLTFASSVALALSFVLIAAGITKNDVSYVFLAPIFLMMFPLSKAKYSNPRKAMIMLVLALVFFGTVKGFFIGHNIGYILRLTAPLMTFLLACLFPGIGRALYERRDLILLAAFAHTLAVFYVVKTGDFLFAERFIPGWTLTFSSFAAVSVWHYFALPFAFLALGKVANRDLGVSNLFYFGLGALTILGLYLLTDTSSYVLAVLVLALLVILPMTILKWARVISFVVLPVLILDFFTSKIISNIIVEFMYRLGIDDLGDILRLIQLDYFVKYSEFFGSGFGAEHAFPLELQADRQVSQIVYPYASELPIINIIYNGGILAGVWFFWLSIMVIDLARFRKVRAGVPTLGLACSAVLFGSISNPYLFAPASMLLLAIMFDVWDESRGSMKPQRAPRVSLHRQPPPRHFR